MTVTLVTVDSSEGATMNLPTPPSTQTALVGDRPLSGGVITSKGPPDSPSELLSRLAESPDESVSRAGIPKLMILNGHGGNDFKQIIREVQATHDDLFICTTNWYRILDGSSYFDDPGDHAGEMETSIMMHLHPDLVAPLSEAGSGTARRFRVRALREGWAWAERKWSQVTEDTGVGDPAPSTPGKGEIFLADVTEKIADFMVELAGCPNDDLYE